MRMVDAPPRPDGFAVAESHRAGGHFEAAIAAYLAAVDGELPEARTCLRLATCHSALGDQGRAVHWLLRVVDASTAYADWHAAAMALGRILASGFVPAARRRVRAWICGSSTTVQFAPLLGLAALRAGIHLQVREGGYGQYTQEILRPDSDLYAAAPDVVVLAVHAGDVLLPGFAADPEAAVAAEARRWTALWESLAAQSAARLVMHNFARPPETVFGHLTTRLPGARHSMMARLNAALGETAGDRVSIVDCDRLAAEIGTTRWLSAKYWHLSKQSCALGALPLLARHTAAVIAADLGLARKCIALDLDNTLWGGIVGEDGVGGLRIGPGDPEGEAFVAFQTYLKQLRDRGVLLAVCSKNNPADARETFLARPEMVLRLDDFAAFEANWTDKPANLRRIAADLGIGLDAIVFVDDNPAEREIVRQVLPEVEVLALPADPADYLSALASSLLFEPASFTAEDGARAASYRSRAAVAELSRAASSIEEFLDSLDMQATIEPIGEANLTRVAQLLAKSNQFNLTTRRHGAEQLRRMIADPAWVHCVLKLRDRLTDHGLVGIAVGRIEDGTLDIDTLVMSCRVIGRTVEHELLSRLVTAARAGHCGAIRGTYIPTEKNIMVADLYPDMGFVRLDGPGGGMAQYLLRLDRWTAPRSFVAVEMVAADQARAEVAHVD